jgi:Tfp pilus assembly protein PilN
MPNVNLIAARREEKKRLERITRELFLGLAASVTILVLLGLTLAADHYRKNADLADAQEKKQKLQPILDQINQIQKDTGNLKPKVDTLETAKRTTLHWRALFTVISQAVPDDVWVNSIRSDGGETGTITLVGMTDSQTHVGDMIRNLEAHPMFLPQVDCTFVNGVGKTGLHGQGAMTSVNGIQPVNFQVVAHLRPPAADTSAAPPSKQAMAGSNGKEYGNGAAA